MRTSSSTLEIYLILVTLMHRSCGRKNRHENEADALAAAGAILKHPNTNTPWLRVYPCPFCDGWHLTKQKEIEAKENHGDTN